MQKKKDCLPPPPCSNVQEYEKSDWWKNKSKKILENKELVCPYCGRPRWVWQPRKKVWKRNIRFVTHHFTYINVPYEKDEDVAGICWTCHDCYHLILRLEFVSPIFKELATVVRKYFRYDKGSACANNYLNGKDKNGTK
jgi:DNA-directed RNA polymerase subunit RPC12/RpoP